MTDRFGRKIEYLRLSITDRCNLRCRYCMPNGITLARHDEVLTYEEFLQVAAAAVGLGITRFKVTGGEPLVRRGCVDFVRRLKALPGVEQVTLTTNGLLLAPLAGELAAEGLLDGVEIDHPRNTPEDKAVLEALAARHGLIVTGGTDFHGINRKVCLPVGSGQASDEMIGRINALAAERKK